MSDDLEVEMPPTPRCEQCGMAYRLVGIEGTDKPHHDLYTFECPNCGDVTVRVFRAQ